MGMGQDGQGGGFGSAPWAPGPGTTPGQNQLGQQIQGYEAPLPNLAQAYFNNLSKGMVDLPSFQEMYQSYRDVASQQAEKASANITEAMGAQGARYGSDIMRQQGQLQRDLATDLRSQAANFQLGLRGQQSQELGGAITGLMSRDMMAQNYMWQDYLRRTSPPPLLGPASTQPGQPPGAVGF